MEYVYNLRQHSHAVSIYLQFGRIEYRIGTNSQRKNPNICKSLVKDRIIYDKKKKEIILWSLPYHINDEFERQWKEMEDRKNEDHVKIDNFVYKLYSAFKKGKSNEKDTINLEHIMSDYIRLIVNFIKEGKSLDSLHYLCVIPREWDQNTREQLLRPIFIQAGLISETDHNDRLLFLSDTESIFYGAQTKKNRSSTGIGPGYFKTGNLYTLCKIEYLEDKTKASIKFDLIEAHPSLFDIPEELLCPRILHSSACIMTEKSIRSSLHTFLEFKLFPSDTQESSLIHLAEYIYDRMDFATQVNKK
ncbi:hypothetical protein BD770DRAFT_400719 [Pilaira anomala]|nr:hypothetical protein BD770DRAFT_400719 [Pilaira anomala]